MKQWNKTNLYCHWCERTFLPREAVLSPTYSCWAWALTVLRSLCVPLLRSEGKSPPAAPRALLKKRSRVIGKSGANFPMAARMCRVLPQELLPGSGSLAGASSRGLRAAKFGAPWAKCARVNWVQTGWLLSESLNLIWVVSPNPGLLLKFHQSQNPCFSSFGFTFRLLPRQKWLKIETKQNQTPPICSNVASHKIHHSVVTYRHL